VGTLIDPSVLVAAERSKQGVAAVLRDHADTEIAIAAITASELLHGIHRATTTAIRARREAFVEAILASVPVLQFDLVTARLHSRIWAELAAKGLNLGAHDLLIGATALAHGMDVATRDLRSFPKIPGLTVVRW
jgi:tRNA(fMet)-specific endonuclease VapC